MRKVAIGVAVVSPLVWGWWTYGALLGSEPMVLKLLRLFTLVAVLAGVIAAVWRRK
jgi:hypothetical protein